MTVIQKWKRSLFSQPKVNVCPCMFCARVFSYLGLIFERINIKFKILYIDEFQISFAHINWKYRNFTQCTTTIKYIFSTNVPIHLTIFTWIWQYLNLDKTNNNKRVGVIFFAIWNTQTCLPNTIYVVKQNLQFYKLFGSSVINYVTVKTNSSRFAIFREHSSFPTHLPTYPPTSATT